MGCGNSKNRIDVVTVKSSDPKQCSDSTTKSRSAGKRTGSNRKGLSSGKSRQSGEAWGSQESLGERSNGSGSDRGRSATSKGSKHSADSGFSDNGNVITEHSDPNAVRDIEDNFETPRELEMGVIGQACPQRLSAKDRNRAQEDQVMQSLREEGLITRPMSRAACGVSFEVIADDAGMFSKRPPARLAKLERRKKKKKNLTQEEIQAKLERAEERRKELEQQRLAKIQAVTNKSDVQNALDTFAEQQKVKITEEKSKLELATEQREQRMNELRDKLKAKKEHAEAVRRRKQLAVPLDESDAPPVTRSVTFSEDTPVGKSLQSNEY